MVKKGDTLIEVTLAVGIFSLIAIAIVSVMSGGISSAQTALETTLAREEIDTQAEALRFIQASYVGDKGLTDSRFTKLWQKIVDSAIELEINDNENPPESLEAILQFNPANCAELYNSSLTSSLYNQKAFIINPRALSSFTEDTIDSVFVPAKNDDAGAHRFYAATTYPRLIYGNTANGKEESAGLVSGKSYNSLLRAEGIYVIAVKDTSSGTSIISGSGTSSKKSAFYDFYIRTCWYGTNANEPSTISTVIRLYNPDIVQTEEQP